VKQADSGRSQIVAAFGRPVALDESVAVSAARLRATHRSLRLADAIVLATAEVRRWRCRCSWPTAANTAHHRYRTC
jgi:PIN domain nuclease of toxin-antitoxin system